MVECTQLITGFLDGVSIMEVDGPLVIHGGNG